jgi:hypothetical protein
LPPEPNPIDCDNLVSLYAGFDLHALFPNGIDFSNPRHKCFRNVTTAIDPTTGGTIETFDSIVEGTFDDGSGPQTTSLAGPVQILTQNGGNSSQTGTFQTEIISMSLTGDVGGVSIDIRESPNRASPGQIRILDIGAGSYQIDSFFDVFLELSVDGGPFQPQTNEASRLELVPVDADGDGDGLSDLDEIDAHGTDPANPDSDSDGLTDGAEVLVHGTDPLDPDSDDDGWDDASEIAAGTDPNDPNSFPTVGVPVLGPWGLLLVTSLVLGVGVSRIRPLSVRNIHP